MENKFIPLPNDTTNNSGFTAAMKSRRQEVSEYLLVKSRRSKEPLKVSVNGGVNSEWIPIDLVVEILSRLPAKSIARCRCVSKLWASIIRRPDFTELFFTRSQARPQLLFACQNRETDELFFFSSPQPQYSDENSSLATASYLMKIPLKYLYQPIWHIKGLVFLRDERILEGRKYRAMVSVICNPSTGKSLVLPKEKTGKYDALFSYSGYDPIEKQLKVLSIAATTYIGQSIRYSQVLTLGTKDISWRKVECCIPHCPTGNVICINGVLYYGAHGSEGAIIVCFDIRSEKFRFMEANNNVNRFGATLINYNGKLGSLVLDEPPFSGRSTNCALWILDDTEKHNWSKNIHVLPPMWKDLVEDISVLDVVGMVGGNEIVFSPHTHSLPFYVFYYSIKRNTIRRVEIQGLEGSKGNRVHTFLNHIEDIKSIDGY